VEASSGSGGVGLAGLGALAGDVLPAACVQLSLAGPHPAPDSSSAPPPMTRRSVKHGPRRSRPASTCGSEGLDPSQPAVDVGEALHTVDVAPVTGREICRKKPDCTSVVALLSCGPVQFRNPGPHTHAILALLKERAATSPHPDDFEAWHSQTCEFLRILYDEDSLSSYLSNGYLYSNKVMKGKHNQKGRRDQIRAEASQELKDLIREYEASEMTVFVGHGGHSTQWAQLDTILEVAKLRPDHFDRTATAGMYVFDRVSGMLNSARFAFLVMSAEDVQRDGKERARQNVVHEAGMCQARLGKERAILLVEEGVEKFSNNDGIVHLGFQKNDLMSASKGIQAVLKREGLLP